MGLFGNIFKVIKKVGGAVVKTGLSAVTHGASDKVLKVLKGTGAVRSVLAKTSTAPTMQEQALVARADLGSYKPSVKRTESVLAGATALSRGKKVGKGGATGKSKRTGLKVYKVDNPANLPAMQAYAKARGGRARLLTAKERAVDAKPKKTKTKRTVPKGGLDLAAIAAQWRAEGKPGSWQAYIKANSHIRK